MQQATHRRHVLLRHEHTIADVEALQAALDALAATITALELDDLADVVITTPATGQVLSFDGADWVNASAASSGYPPQLGHLGW